MINIEIETYTDIYKEQVIQLILNIQNEEFNISISIKDQPDLNCISQVYQNGCGNFWVALDKGKVVGTVALIDIGNGEVALRKMFVDKNYRGREKRVAQVLLDKVFVWCKDKRISAIYLGTTSVYLAAHRFYEKNGFQEITKFALPSAFPLMEVDSKFYKYCF